MKKLCLISLFTLTGLALQTAQAEILYPTGENGDNHHSSEPDFSTVGISAGLGLPMDDFYVPGLGWSLSGVRLFGQFLSAGPSPARADVRIWPAEFPFGEPVVNEAPVMEFLDIELGDGMSAEVLKGVGLPGEEFFEVTLNFPYQSLSAQGQFAEHYLKGGRFYWIDFDIRSASGQNLAVVSTGHGNVNYLPGRSGSVAQAAKKDLAYELHGQSAARSSKLPLSPEKTIFKAKRHAPTPASHNIFIADSNHRFDAGLYQIKREKGRISLYHTNNVVEGKFRPFRPDPGSSKVELTTPEGDNLCRGTENDPGLHSFCQSFVACAYYELWCPSL